MQAKNIHIQSEKCLGCGACVAVAPGTFAFGDDGKAIIVDPPTDEEKTIRIAAESCPTECISLDT